MDINNYLKRISFTNKVHLNNDSLFQLHENHVLNVPFENLDIYFNRIFDLELDNIYKKVIENSRGGFCYELNLLFNNLLSQIGFESRIIEARIFDELGNLGPRYDHMAILVETDKKYLLDVGFGDLFIKPLQIKDGIQNDGKNQFKIESLEENNYLLLMCSNEGNFNKKYTFHLNTVQANEFYDICLDKQTNPLSYFVKNTICTKPTSFGRLTIFNNKLIEKKGSIKTEKSIFTDNELKEILNVQFNLKLI